MNSLDFINKSMKRSILMALILICFALLFLLAKFILIAKIFFAATIILPIISFILSPIDKKFK